MTNKRNIRKRGRPKLATESQPLLVRMHPPLLKALDNWRRANVTRPEAIRQLVEWALTKNQI